MNKVFFSSITDNWTTPKSLYEKLNDEFSFDYDPCPLFGHKGLTYKWGKSNFVNPPYSNISAFVDEAIYYADYYGSVSVLLVPSRTDTKWFHKCLDRYCEIRFIKGRLKFGGSKNNAPFPSCIIIIK